jgi:hypothetical protein
MLRTDGQQLTFEAWGQPKVLANPGQPHRQQRL